MRELIDEEYAVYMKIYPRCQVVKSQSICIEVENIRLLIMKSPDLYPAEV